MKQNRKRLKMKKRSCGLCKPWKKGWVDRRPVAWKKEDLKAGQELKEISR